MTTPNYDYKPPTEHNFGLLPDGQYPFVVIEVSDLYTSNKGNTVLPVKLAVGPDKLWVFDSPNAGVTKDGRPYDRIAEFLVAVRRDPKPGQRADLSKNNLVGARGEVMIKREEATQGSMKGKLVNRVDFYIWAQPAATSTSIVPRQEDIEPDDIPF